MWLKIFLFLSLLGALVAFGNGPFNDGSDLFTRSADSSSHDPNILGSNETGRIDVEKLLESIRDAADPTKNVNEKILLKLFFFPFSAEIVQLLSQTPRSETSALIFQSATDQGTRELHFTLSATDFSKNNMDVKFSLHKIHL